MKRLKSNHLKEWKTEPVIAGVKCKQSPHSGRFSEILSEVTIKAEIHGFLTLRDLIDLVGPKGHCLLILFLSLPFLQPIPLPGLSVLFGLSIALLGTFMILGKPPWLPVNFAARSVSSAHVKRICRTLEQIAGRMESWIRPRGRVFFKGRWSRTLIGASVFCLGFFLSLPLPVPATNSLPAWGLFFLSLAVLEEDVAVLALGVLLTFINLCLFAALAAIPALGWRWIGLG